MARRILVIGLGRFGISLAQNLSRQKCDVVAIDRDMGPVEAIKDEVAYAAQVDATDVEGLRSIDAGSVDTAVVGIGENFEAAMLCVAALKEIGVKRVVARAQTPRHARILAAIGASDVVEIESEMGRRLSETILGSAPLAGS